MYVFNNNKLCIDPCSSTSAMDRRVGHYEESIQRAGEDRSLAMRGIRPASKGLQRTDHGQVEQNSSTQRVATYKSLTAGEQSKHPKGCWDISLQVVVHFSCIKRNEQKPARKCSTENGHLKKFLGNTAKHVRNLSYPAPRIISFYTLEIITYKVKSVLNNFIYTPFWDDTHLHHEIYIQGDAGMTVYEWSTHENMTISTQYASLSSGLQRISVLSEKFMMRSREWSHSSNE